MPHDLHLLLTSSVVPDLTPSPFLVSFGKTNQVDGLEKTSPAWCLVQTPTGTPHCLPAALKADVCRVPETDPRAAVSGPRKDEPRGAAVGRPRCLCPSGVP